MKEKWTTVKAPVPSRKIAQVSLDRRIGVGYISGLISEKADFGIIYGLSIAEQTKIILDNLSTIVTEMGLTMEHVIKTNIFLSDMNGFDEMNAVYGEYFSEDNPPARQCVGAEIWGGLGVEISAVVILE